MNVCIEAVVAEAVVEMVTAVVSIARVLIQVVAPVTTASVLRFFRNGRTSMNAVAPDFNFLGGTAAAVV